MRGRFSHLLGKSLDGLKLSFQRHEAARSTHPAAREFLGVIQTWIVTELRSFHLLVNPLAGRGRAAATAKPVVQILRSAGHRVSATWSCSPDEVAERAAAAVASGGVVVGVGGDGMVASLVGPMAELSSQGGILGLLPAGRGNDFARMLGISSDPRAIAARLMQAAPRRVDLIDCAGRYVAGSVYAGIDADAARMASQMTRVPASLQYLLAGVRAVARYQPRNFHLSLDGRRHEFEAGMVVVANSQYYGKGMRVAPAASVTDGELDVIIVGALGKVELVSKMLRIYRGTHVKDSAVQVFRARRVELAVVGAESLPVGADGEDLGFLPELNMKPMQVHVSPGALRVL